MKKLLLTIALLISGLIATAQPASTQMSDYEKYVLARDQGITQDTVKVKKDTLKTETDDLYYNPQTDQKHVTTIFSKKNRQPKPVQVDEELYTEGYQDGLEDAGGYYDYNDFYYANRLSRFHSPFYFPYYSSYWRFSYGWYDPFYWDMWYSPYYSYGWGYPYYGYGYGWGYPYYGYGYGWGYPYYGGGYYHIDYRNANHGYGILGQRSYGYDNHYNYISTTSRTGMYKNNGIVPNSYSRNSSDMLGMRRSSPTTSKSVTTQPRTIAPQSQTRRVATITNRNSTVKSPAVRSNTNTQVQTRTSTKSYTPSYSQPRMSTKPMYNNTNTNSTRLNNNQRYNYTLPQTQSKTTTQPRSSVSTPRTSSPSRSNSYSAPRSYTPSKSYSTPSRSYSAPSRSSSSSYSPSRSSSSYSSGSSMSRSSGNYSGSSSGSSSSGSMSSGSSSGGGRRK